MKTYFTQLFHLLLVIFLLGLNIQVLKGQTNPNAIVYNSTINQDLKTPIRLAVDKADNIFVTDASSKKVIKYDLSGNILESIITGGSPLSVAINLNNEIFVGEEEGKILKISGGIVTNFYTDTIYPSDMDFSPEGKLFIVDSRNKRVIVLDANGNKIQEFGSGILLYPTSIAYDYQNQRIFVTEHGGTNGGFTAICKVWVFNLAGVSTGSFGSGGNGNGKFYRIQGIDVGKCGNIYVNDPYQGKISVYNENLVFVTKFGVYGDSLSQLNLPMDIVFDSHERILVTSANTSKIEMFNIVDTLPSSFIQYSESTINCVGQSRQIPIHFTGTPPWTFTYTVDGLNPTTVTTSDNPYVINATGPGIYEVVSLTDANYTGSCLTGYAKVNYSITTLPPTSTIASISQSICDGETANIEITFTGSAPWTFTYTQNGQNPQTLTTSDNIFLLPISESGAYEITELSADGCPGSGSIGYEEISVNPAPTSDFLEGNNQFKICRGESLDLHLNFSGTPPWNFTYTVDGLNPVTVNGIMTNSYSLPATESGIYQVTEISDAHCSNNVTIGSPTLIVNELPTVVTTNGNVEVCVNGSIDVTNYFTGQAPWSITYTKDNINLVSINNINTNPFVFELTEAGNYQITELFDANCTSSDITGYINIAPLPAPIPSFNYIVNGWEVSFMNNSLNADSYLWDFGDSQTSILENPVHQYLVSNVYQVYLTATNNLCGDSTIVNVIDFTVNIDDLDNNLSVELFPNPSKGKFAIVILNPEEKNFIIEIIDISGQKIFSKEYTDYEYFGQIDLGNQSDGFYLVKYISSNKTITKKLIISK